jgi:hypothetical protein
MQWDIDHNTHCRLEQRRNHRADRQRDRLATRASAANTNRALSTVPASPTGALIRQPHSPHLARPELASVELGFDGWAVFGRASRCRGGLNRTDADPREHRSPDATVTTERTVLAASTMCCL